MQQQVALWSVPWQCSILHTMAWITHALKAALHRTNQAPQDWDWPRPILAAPWFQAFAGDRSIQALDMLFCVVISDQRRIRSSFFLCFYTAHTWCFQKVAIATAAAATASHGMWVVGKVGDAVPIWSWQTCSRVGRAETTHVRHERMSREVFRAV